MPTVLAGPIIPDLRISLWRVIVSTARLSAYSHHTTRLSLNLRTYSMASSAKLVFTPLAEISMVHERLKSGFRSGKLKSLAYRKEQIAQLAYLLKDNSQLFEDALMADLKKNPTEAHFMEIGPSHAAIVHALTHLETWVQTSSAPFSSLYFAMSPKVRHEAKGTVLVLSPFNFPLFLSLPALASAIAAGNTVALKPSEQSQHMSALFAELIPKYMDPDVVGVLNGGIEETSKILELRWDHIFFTGSTKVGKIVASAAAKHLTPVTLELGGKSPVIIDPKLTPSELKTLARRILWGKLTNAGQTCVAPDYALVQRDFQDTFIEALKEAHEIFYPDGPQSSDSYGRIITQAHTERLQRLIMDTKGTIVLGGESDKDSKYIAPTIVKDVSGGDALMEEELFGPILPIVPVENLDEAIDFINEREHPLSLMVFSTDAAFQAKVFDNTSSGACLANECVLHVGFEGIPFGGVGNSGYGSHGGIYGFKAFSHERATLSSPTWLDYFLHLRYPPYNTSATNKVKSMWSEGKIPHPRPGEKRGWLSWLW